ncbi:D-amino-acid transaminase [Kroppenstedtia eburnea]|uniref:D-amino-acid transaminase n=1 Tax=Kroppenstedtia eburnea TaxID=714067 RepID=UPI00362AC920
MVILFDEQLIPRNRAYVDIEDRGYQFGDGVYEVIRVYGGKMFCKTQHLSRLEQSAKEIRLHLPFSLERLDTLLEELVSQNRLREGTIYLQVSRGTAPRNHPFPEQARPMVVAYTTEAPRPLQTLREGVRAITEPDLRWLRCDIKSLNLLGAVLAKQKAVDSGCQETILHRDGRVTEGSSTNVFIVKDGQLATHPADNFILRGITRDVVIESAHELGIPVTERVFSVEELFRADEVFISSTTMEVTPVVSIDGRKVGTGSPGPLTRQLQTAFEKRISYSGSPS